MLPLGPAGSTLLGLIRFLDARLAYGSVTNARLASLENQRRRDLLDLATEHGLDLSKLSRSA